MDKIKTKKKGILTIASVVILLIITGLIWSVGSNNPQTPAGYVGYVTRGAVLGKTSFVGLQNGPTSPGRGWLLNVKNVSITPYSYNESYTLDKPILSQDNMGVALNLNIVWRVHPDKVKEFIEKFSTLQTGEETADQVVQTAYNNYIKEPLRTITSAEVRKVNGLDIGGKLVPIGDEIFKQINARTKETPFEVISIAVGSPTYGEEVTKSISAKIARSQDLETKEIEVSIAKKEAEKRVAEAHGIADAMNIINSRLTSLYLQHEAIEAQKLMVGSPNHTTIYIPVGNMGVPTTGTFNTATGQ